MRYQQFEDLPVWEPGNSTPESGIKRPSLQRSVNRRATANVAGSILFSRRKAPARRSGAVPALP
jgi:hypothetical protein